ncbi:MAG TPA: sulfotransferase [Solirubrobacteraceae bacterium]
MSDSPRGTVPDFFIAGNPRSGTTALYRMLRQHPAIFMPDFKEPRFFAPDAQVRAPDPSKPSVRPRTLEAYEALFAPAQPGQLMGDGSPQYLRSPQAPALIAEQRPDARIVAILREPVAYLHSFHTQSVQSTVETERDFARAIALEDARRAGHELPPGVENPAWLMYCEHARYLEHLRRYEAHFAPEQMLVLIYDDYRDDGAATLRRVLRFLGVDEDPPIESVVTAREARQGVRSPTLHRFTRAMRMARNNPDRSNPMLSALARLAPGPAIETWRRLVYTQAPQPDAAFTAELRKQLKPEVTALSEHLGRDLVGLWGYEDG